MGWSHLQHERRNFGDQPTRQRGFFYSRSCGGRAGTLHFRAVGLNGFGLCSLSPPEVTARPTRVCRYAPNIRFGKLSLLVLFGHKKAHYLSQDKCKLSNPLKIRRSRQLYRGAYPFRFDHPAEPFTPKAFYPASETASESNRAQSKGAVNIASLPSAEKGQHSFGLSQ